MATVGLTFYPLYWMFHDTWLWQYHKTGAYGKPDTNYYWYHQGHCHFWMMGFDATTQDQKAYKGNQIFNVRLNDTWSPNASDPNFQNNFRVVGRPIWYFRIVEHWRRVYIQQWDYRDTNDPVEAGFVGKRGIKYDACLDHHKNGPFREGKDVFAMFHDMPRTLPIEYWRDENKYVRDHYLRKETDPNPYNPKIFVNPERYGFFDFGVTPDTITNDYQPANRDYWMIPRGSIAGYNYPDGGGDPREDIARRTAYPDYYYIYPTLEYQRVVQLDWQRLPGWQDRDVEDWHTGGENFGDFYSNAIMLPFSKEGTVQSPFSDSSGKVYPPGTYCNNVVKPEDMLRYATGSNEFVHPYKAGELMTFHDAGHPIDGKWVEQFLGGTVQANCQVVIEDKWGGRSLQSVLSTEFFIKDAFEGVDQREPEPE